MDPLPNKVSVHFGFLMHTIFPQSEEWEEAERENGVGGQRYMERRSGKSCGVQLRYAAYSLGI